MFYKDVFILLSDYFAILSISQTVSCHICVNDESKRIWNESIVGYSQPYPLHLPSIPTGNRCRGRYSNWFPPDYKLEALNQVARQYNFSCLAWLHTNCTLNNRVARLH